MSTPATLPLGDIVNVIVQISPVSPAQPTFNQGLIVGYSAVIPSFGPNSRVRQYTAATFASQMLTDGFASNSPEYIAAGLYFGQSQSPQVLWVGRQDLTVITTIAPHAANEGTGYQLNDVLAVIQGGGSGGTVKVTSIGGSGQVTGVSIVTAGTGYAVANGLTTTGGHGTGAQMDISVIGETALTAVQACRTANFQWYGLMVCYSPVDVGTAAEHQAIAAYIQTATPVGVYFYSTSDANVPTGVAGNIFLVLQTLGYNRATGVYSTNQSGQFPNNLYGAAAYMGRALGLNTGLANSSWTMKFKNLVGVAPEPVTESTRGIIESQNGNLYLSFANSYVFLEQSVMANGQFLDEIIQLDVLVSAMQFNVMNLLVDSDKVPQTDPGQTQLIHAVNQACETSRSIGFIAAGTWTGPSIVVNPNGSGLNPGDTIPTGYLCLSPPYSSQSQANRQARQSMPIYVAIIEAGAVHSVLIAVIVQR